MTENCKLRRAILSAFYNISQRNFRILLIWWCSFKLWWNFCPDQNFSYKVKGPLKDQLAAARNTANTISYVTLFESCISMNKLPPILIFIIIWCRCSHAYETATPILVLRNTRHNVYILFQIVHIYWKYQTESILIPYRLQTDSEEVRKIPSGGLVVLTER
jgi:hypothetical protein